MKTKSDISDIMAYGGLKPAYGTTPQYGSTQTAPGPQGYLSMLLRGIARSDERYGPLFASAFAAGVGQAYGKALRNAEETTGKYSGGYSGLSADLKVHKECGSCVCSADAAKTAGKSNIVDFNMYKNAKKASDGNRRAA